MLKGGVLTALVCLFSMGGIAQKVTLQLASLPANTQSDSVFAAGTFNGWQPGLENYRFSRNGQLVMQVKKGTVIAFKCTLGSWQKVEVTQDGASIDNRTFVIAGDTTITVAVAAWSHSFAAKIPKKTATPQVKLLDSAFQMLSLNRKRTIRIYLPPDYDITNKHYAVLYMHDGQNLFDASAAAFGEWQIDETLDSLYRATAKSMIVVGIDHGGENRIREYSPYATQWFTNGEGKAYVEFLVRELFPFINQHYRILQGPANTWVAGSSMGGVISWYAAVSYPNIFGGAGIFSPAYWTSPQFEKEAKQLPTNVSNTAFYFYAGGAESKEMVPDTEKMAGLTQMHTTQKVALQIIKGGKHNEATWAKQFHHFLAFVLHHTPAFSKGQQ